jgi:hypothetical protein
MNPKINNKRLVLLALTILAITGVLAQTPVEVDKNFINSLGNKDFQAAYNLSKNPNWGTFEQFRSVQSFGGITKTQIIDLTEKPDEQSLACIYADVIYTDPINGNAQITEKFYLTKINGYFIIISLKILTFERLCEPPSRKWMKTQLMQMKTESPPNFEIDTSQQFVFEKLYSSKGYIYVLAIIVHFNLVEMSSTQLFIFISCDANNSWKVDNTQILNNATVTFTDVDNDNYPEMLIESRYLVAGICSKSISIRSLKTDKELFYYGTPTNVIGCAGIYEENKFSIGNIVYTDYQYFLIDGIDRKKDILESTVTYTFNGGKTEEEAFQKAKKTIITRRLHFDNGTYISY